MGKCCMYEVTLSWGGKPILARPGSDYIYPYDYEMIKRGEHYPDGPGSWPRCPVCGEKYPIDKRVKTNENTA